MPDSKANDRASQTTIYTAEELAEFDRLTLLSSSHDQLKRIEGRLALVKFMDQHSGEKCDAMWKVIKDAE